MRRRVAYGAAVLAVAVVSVGVWFALAERHGGPHGAPPVTAEMQAFEPIDPPRPAPEISFSDAAGNSVGLNDFRGEFILLNFWATWCAPCVHELPSLDRLQAALGGPDFRVVALSIDRDGPAAVAAFFGTHGIENLAVYNDPLAAASRDFVLRGLPTTLVIDPQGRLRGSYTGPAEWDSPAAVALIRHYLGG